MVFVSDKICTCNNGVRSYFAETNATAIESISFCAFARFSSHEIFPQTRYALSAVNPLSSGSLE